MSRRIFETQHVYADALDQQRARALLVINVVLGVISLVAGLPIAIASGNPSVLYTTIGLFFVAVVSYALLQRGYLRVAGGLFVAILIAASFFPEIESGVNEPTVIMFALPIVTAALVVGGIWTVVASAFSGIAFAVLAWLQMGRIGGVGTEAGEHLLILTLSAEMILAMLAVMSWGLAQGLTRWASEAQRRADQLAATLVVGRVASTVYELEEMLIKVAEATREQFGIYHAHIYLYDLEEDRLEMVAGSGEAGRIMRETGHVLRPGEGIVGRVYRTGEPFLAQDVRQVSSWLPNPLVPDTRSELTVPISSPIGVIGVLDLQSSVVGGLGESDLEVAQGLAGQLGIALQNLRLLAGTREQAQFTQTLLNNLAEGIIAFDLDYRIIEVNPAFERMVGYFKDDLLEGDYRELISPDCRAVQEEAMETLRRNRPVAPLNITYVSRFDERVPVRVNGALLRNLQDEHVGYIVSVQDTAEERAMRVRQEVASEVGRHLTSVLDVGTLLQDLVNVVQERLNYYHVHIYLFEGDNVLKVVEGTGEAGRQLKASEHRIPADAEMSLVARAARMARSVIVNDAREDPAFLPNPLLPDTRSEAAIPLIVSDRVIGVLDVQHSQAGHFTQGEVLTLEGLSHQLGIAIQNADLFASTQRALAETSLLLLSVRRMLDAKDESGAYDVLLETLSVEDEIDRVLIGLSETESHYSPEAVKIVGAYGWDEGDARVGKPIPLNDWPLAAQVDDSLDIFVYHRDVPESRQQVGVSGLEYLDEHNVNTALLAPLARGKQFFGLALIESCGDHKLSDDQVNVCRSLCEQISIVLENYRLLREAREAQERYYDLYHSAPAGYQLLDSTGLLIDVNQTELDWLGYDREEIVGSKYFWELMPPDGQLVFQETMQQILEGDRQEDTELELLRKDGSVLPVRATSMVVHDDQGNVAAIRGVLIDISEERGHTIREQLAYQLGQQASSVLQTEQLLQEVVDQLALMLGYYHAHVYLLDEDHHTLTVMAGTGAAGAEMKATGHNLPLSAEVSLVAEAGRTLESIVIDNVTHEPMHLPNPLLPETGSEAAIPLHVGERLLGVLDVQHRITGYFSPSELQMLENLASQISISLDNARLFDQVQASMGTTAKLLLVSQRVLAADSPRAVYEILLDVISQDENVDKITVLQAGSELTSSAEHTELVAAWNRTQEMVRSGDEVGERYTRGSFPFSSSEGSLTEPTIYDIPGDDHLDEELREAAEAIGIRSVIQIPLVHGDDWFGEVIVESCTERSFTSAGVQLLKAIVDLAATALQNLMLLDHMEHALERERLAHDLTQRVAMQLDPDLLLQEVVDQLAATFDYYHAQAYTFDEGDQRLVIGAGTGEAGALMKVSDHNIPMSAEISLVARAARSLEPVVVGDLSESDSHLPNPLLPLSRAEAAIPLRVGERLLGVFDVQHTREDAFGETEVRTLQMVANQVSVALANAELFTETQASLEREHLAHTLTRQIAKQLDPEKLLQEMVDYLAETFNYYHAHVYTLDGSGEMLTVSAGLGFAGEQLKAIGHTILLSAERSLVAEAARMLEPMVINDVTRSSTYLPNPLLPNTRAEVAIPMQIGGRLIGVLDVQHAQVAGFDEAEIRTLQIVAGQAAVALANAELFRETERALERERIAYQLAQRLTTLLDPELLLQEVVDQLAKTFDYYHVHVYTLSEDGKYMTVAAGLGQAGERMKATGHRISLSTEVSLVAEAARELTPVVVEDVTQTPEHLPNPFLPRTRAEAAIPLHVGERLIGVLDVQHTELGHFTEPEVRTLQIIANQAAIALSNAELYREQIQITERLREVDLLKSEFLATMSHELRTPLNSIIGYSELLIDEVGPQLNETSREDLDAVHSSSHHLLAIINDILDLAKIEAGRMALDCTELDLKEFLPEIVEMSRVLLEDKPVELKLELPDDLPPMKADQTRLRQVIWNLLSNAIKFTEEGEVVVGCRPDRDCMHFFVRDSGVGIALEHQNIIFDRFRQIDGSLTRKKGGTGLGLAITRHLVEMHDGKIWLESELGAGTTFYFDLPLQEIPVSGDGHSNGSQGDGASTPDEKTEVAKR